MIVIPSKQIVYCDVDGTLVLWDPTPEQSEKFGIDITSPCSFSIIDGEAIPTGTWTARLVPHNVHIEQLKRFKMRGHTVVVWSAGGWDWCKVVVEALRIEPYVDLVISKPTWVMDDLPASEFMPK